MPGVEPVERSSEARVVTSRSDDPQQPLAQESPFGVAPAAGLLWRGWGMGEEKEAPSERTAERTVAAGKASQ